MSTAYRAPTAKLSSQGRKDITVISEADVERLTVAAAPELKLAIPFAAYTGIRLGELMALCNVYGALPGRLDISRQRKRNGKFKKPKGEHERTIIVPPQAMPFGSIDGWICELSRTQHHRLWRASLQTAELDLDWHELRHFAATWWLARGASPEDVAVQLGHRDGGKLVRELYGHTEEQALDRLRELVA